MIDNWKVICTREIAEDSPDHIYPLGTKNDNSTNPTFILEAELRLGKGLYHLDLGCSGGQLVIDMNNKEHHSIGLEGSDYSIKHERANWPEYYNKSLFLCDLSLPWSVMLNDSPAKFDLITAWELLEHFKEEDVPLFLDQVKNHLKPGGLFTGSICTRPATDTFLPETPVEHHQCLRPIEWWISQLEKHFVFTDRFRNVVRDVDKLFTVSIK